ncbi:MAG: sigma-70 family RNA polymerase sigma factor [Burkholderiales bacterium]
MVAADEDLLLVDRALAGETQAFEELVHRHQGRVYRTTLSVTCNPEDAEDALQDTFLNAYKHLREFRRDSRFTTWLTRIAINAALQKLRRRRENVSLDEPDFPESMHMPKHFENWQQNPEQLYAAEELRRIVQEAIAAVPPTYRVVLVLRDIAEMDTVETAEVLGLTIAAMKSRLLRARLMVRDHLAARFEKRPGWKSKFVRAGWMFRGMMTGRLAKLPGQKEVN